MSIAARIDAVVQAFGPVREHSVKEGAPYRIITLPSGDMRVEVTNADGDRLGASGATLADAVAALEKKVPHA